MYYIYVYNISSDKNPYIVKYVENILPSVITFVHRIWNSSELTRFIQDAEMRN